jgi:hypothetical protein
MNRWLRSQSLWTGPVGGLLIGILGSFLASKVDRWTSSLWIQVGSFSLPIVLPLLIAYLDLRLKKMERFFFPVRTVSVDMCWGAITLNLGILLPASISQRIGNIDWLSQIRPPNIFIMLGLLVGYGLILCWCLLKQSERFVMCNRESPISTEEEKHARRNEYFAGFLAIVAFVSAVAILWHSESNWSNLQLKVVSSSLIGGLATVWILWLDDVHIEWKELNIRADKLLRYLCTEGGIRVAEAENEIIALGNMSTEERRKLIEDAGYMLSEAAESILLSASEDTWQDWLLILKRRRR